MSSPTHPDGPIALDDFVELTLPAQNRHLRLVRLAASGFTIDLGASIEWIEDLRLAVGEVCALLVEFAEPNSRLSLSYRHYGDLITVEGRCPANSAEPISLDPVAEAVLSNTVDDFRVESDDSHNFFHLNKQLNQD